MMCYRCSDNNYQRHDKRAALRLFTAAACSKPNYLLCQTYRQGSQSFLQVQILAIAEQIGTHGELALLIG